MKDRPFRLCSSLRLGVRALVLSGTAVLSKPQRFEGSIISVALGASILSRQEGFHRHSIKLRYRSAAEPQPNATVGLGAVIPAKAGIHAQRGLPAATKRAGRCHSRAGGNDGLPTRGRTGKMLAEKQGFTTLQYRGKEYSSWKDTFINLEPARPTAMAR